MKRGDLVQLKNEYVQPMEFGVSLHPHPDPWGDAVGYFERTQVGILLDQVTITWEWRVGQREIRDPIKIDSSLVLVGDTVGWMDTVDLEVVL